jgi:hypothetical protein
MDKEGFEAASGIYQLGVIKFYLPKWDMFFVHMYSLEEGVTEFTSLPKAMKLVNSRLQLSTDGEVDIGVDFSILSKDRYWFTRSQMAALQILSDKPIWSRPSVEGASVQALPHPTEWTECSECKYLIDGSSEHSISCHACKSCFHDDCLYGHERLAGPGYDPTLSDKQEKRYERAAAKWKARKTSKNPSLLLDSPDEEATDNVVQTSPDAPVFTCGSCRDCRYCCTPLRQEIVPATTISIEPSVICKKCNAAAHGWCVFPAVPKLHSSVEWVCDDCRDCNSCGRVTYLNDSTGMPSLLTDWALPSFDQCKQCFAGLDKGEYCPMCMKAWTQEWGGDMVQCDLCEFWVHVNCDNLGNINLNKLAQSEVKYTCPICRDNTDVHRRRRVIDLLRTIDKVALFAEPVAPAFLAVYLKVIKNPMDLARMRQRNDSNESYPSNIEFIRDFELIVDNAKIFNMPNSPAYRLAEQFHKQGKLLIEKYLLADRKGAQMIEGIEDEEGGRRTAALQASNNWKRNKPRKITYQDIIDLIKRDDTTSSKTTLVDSTVSPLFRRKGRISLLSPRGANSPNIDASVSPPEASLPSPSTLSDFELGKQLMKIFGLKSSWYIQNGGFAKQPDSVSYFHLPTDCSFDTLLTRSVPLTSEQVVKSARWCLHEICGACNSFGDSGCFVDCAECGESVHHYCAGLISGNLGGGKPNPLNGGREDIKKFFCANCTRCRFCDNRTSHGIHCGLCGNISHPECRSKYVSTPPVTVGGDETGWPQYTLCDKCPLDQALSFFRAPYCKGCDCALHPGVAGEFLKALPNKEEEKSIESVGPTKISPVINCIACGTSWHTRCLPEFSDMVVADIVGVYVCRDCGDGSGKPVDEILSSMGTLLKIFKARMYRETQIDTVLESLRASGVTISVARDDPLLNDLLEIFQAASGCVPSGQSALEKPDELDEVSRAWIEWGIIHRDFLVALGPAGEQTIRKKLVKNLDENSIRVKRADDEDLLFARRMFATKLLLDCVINGGESMDTKLEETGENCVGRLVPFTADTAVNPISSDGEIGACQLKAWLNKHGYDRGYTGLGVGKSVVAVPGFENRNCVFCNVSGDHIVFGNLVPCGVQEWVHTECLAWTFPVVAPAPAAMVDSKFLVPRCESPTADEGPIVELVDKAVVLQTVENGSMDCFVCGESGATVRCQQCHQVAFHLPCAILSNQDKLVMDSRCRLLTCSRCLYRSPDFARLIQTQFTAGRNMLKWTHSAVGQLQAFRRNWRVEITGSSDTAVMGPVRQGSLTIINRGSIAHDFQYDGSPNVIPVSGFSSIRLFYGIETPLTHSEESSFLKMKSDFSLVRKSKRVAYLSRIEETGCSIEIIGGRVVAVGGSVDECFSEFTGLFVTNSNYRFPHYMTGRWFFGLESACMRSWLHEVALKSLKKQASVHRSDWVYHPQLREAVTNTLGMGSDKLATLTSWRRRNRDNKDGVDQLKSLGRVVCPMESIKSEDAYIMQLLDPELVTKSGDNSSKPSRLITSDSGSAASKYKIRIAVPDTDLLDVCRSKIHNYGLFAGKSGFQKGDHVVEYQGEILRETIADEREKRAERAGNGDGGSCYMFRLDDDHVVDATVKGNCARFINHSCQANCACKMIEDENRKKHIMIIAKRDIAPGEEITYDYQFAVESEKLACLCGAPNCLGRLN